MTQIIPAILEKKFADVTKRMESVLDLVETVQIDVCDGIFVDNVSWPYASPVVMDGQQNYDEFFKEIVDGEGEVDMPMWEEFNFELDLMVAKPAERLKDLLTTGPSRVVFHAESFVDVYSEMHDLIKKIPPLVTIGVAINVDTNPEILFPLIDDKIISFVQCMGIAHIGKQGEALDERVYHNLKTFRAKYPDFQLSVDGGVNLDNATKLEEAGANRLVIGSAIFTAPKIPTRIAEFENLLQ